MNDLIARGLSSAGYQSRLEPTNLVRNDGKRPDGTTLIPWEKGRYLVWDATCPDTYAASYVSMSANQPGAAADMAEKRKLAKYCQLPRSTVFVPVAVETSGCYGQHAAELLRRIGAKLEPLRASPSRLTTCASEYR